MSTSNPPQTTLIDILGESVESIQSRVRRLSAILDLIALHDRLNKELEGRGYKVNASGKWEASQ